MTETGLKEFVLANNISHAEVASVNFDQWMLTIGMRAYEKNESVAGMFHVIFTHSVGFRVLDEGQMLNFPWPLLSDSGSFVHRVDESGWMDMEKQSGNLFLQENAVEYVIITSVECVSVIAYEPPKLVVSSNGLLCEQKL